MNFTPDNTSTISTAIPSAGENTSTGRPTTDLGTTEKVSVWDRLKNSTVLNAVANTAAQSLTGNGTAPQIYENTEVIQNQSWFEKNTLISSFPNWATAAAGSVLIIGAVYIITKEDTPPKKKKRR